MLERSYEQIYASSKYQTNREQKYSETETRSYIRLISNCLSLTVLLTPIRQRTYTKVTFSARHYLSTPDLKPTMQKIRKIQKSFSEQQAIFKPLVQQTKRLHTRFNLSRMEIKHLCNRTYYWSVKTTNMIQMTNRVIHPILICTRYQFINLFEPDTYAENTIKRAAKLATVSFRFVAR